MATANSLAALAWLLKAPWAEPSAASTEAGAFPEEASAFLIAALDFPEESPEFL
jgi:hypothetical protein